MAKCPRCEGADFKKASLVYAEGTGVGLGGMIGGAGANIGIGVNVSAAALRAGPPKRQGILSMLFWLAVIYANGLVFIPRTSIWFDIFAWGWLVISVLALMSARSEYKKAHQQAMADYDAMFMCLRCGTFSRQFE